MSVSCVVVYLLVFVTLTCSLPSAQRRDDVVNGLRVVSAPVNTTTGGVHHAYWFRRLFDTTLSAQEAACAQNATVFHAGSGRCAWLFEQGPCAARQWLVLDRDGGGGELRPVCRRRPCAPGYGFLADEARCAPQQDLCAGNGRVFRYSLRGEGRCHCTGFRTQGPDEQCHNLFAQGPCQKGQVLAPGYGPSLDSFRGACVRSPCAEQGQVRVENEDGGVGARCQALGSFECTLTPAPLLSKESGVWVALCHDDSTRFALQVKSQPSSGKCAITDGNGKCAEIVSHSPQPFDWGFDEADEAFGGARRR